MGGGGRRWLERLPDAVRRAGGSGAPCALFWPGAAEGAAAAARQPSSMGLLARLRASPTLHTLRLALQVCGPACWQTTEVQHQARSHS